MRGVVVLGVVPLRFVTITEELDEILGFGGVENAAN